MPFDCVEILPGLPHVPAHVVRNYTHADTLHIDFESRSVVDIKQGVYKYAEHPSTLILCLGYKFNHEPAALWEPSQPFPRRIIDHILAGKRVVAHNMAFDRVMWNVVLIRQMAAIGVNIPPLLIEQCDCTMVRALALGLPGALDKLCQALRMPVGKDSNGKWLISKLCKPQKLKGQLYWNNDPELLRQFFAYCRQDVEAEAPVDEKLPPLDQQERLAWFMSERINDRGLAADVLNAQRAAALVEVESAELSKTVSKLTRGQATATQRAKLLAWMDNHGYELPNLKKHTVRDALRSDELAVKAMERIKQVLQLQTEANKSSTAKLKKLLTRVCADNRVRGEYRFNGASTARWSSTGIQLHNLTRPSKDFKLPDAENIFGWLQHPLEGARRAIRREYGSVMIAVSDCIRPMLVAGPGCDLLAADYSNIEGRVLAWLAGEHWKLEAFRQYDTIIGYDEKGKAKRAGPDLYKLAFSKTFGVPVDSVDDDQRQVGKVIELALGYQSGHGGFLEMAAGYDADIDDISNVVRAQTSDREWNRYAEMYDKKGANHYGLEKFQWTAVKVLITKWREANSSIRDYWKNLEEACVAAVSEPGKITGVGCCYFQVHANFLWIRLPSGRKLAYAYPSLTEIDTPWGERKQSVRVWGVDKGFFGPYHLYGGLVAENCLAGESLVATARGWVRLDAVRADDSIWDGEAFVAHAGLIAKGVQETISLDGVRMTPDHKVLTEDGWRCASSCEGFNRAAVRLPASGKLRRFGRQKVVLASALRLRHDKNSSSNRAYERQRSVLWLSASKVGVCASTDARYVKASGLCSLAVNDRSLHASDASGLAQLRRARYCRMRHVAAEFRGVLAGYGPNVQKRTDARPERQLAGVQPGKLPVDNTQSAEPQQARQHSHKYEVGAYNRSGRSRKVRYRGNYNSVPDSSPLAGKPLAISAGRSEQVYDLVNCGPRNRFVVLSDTGPLVVHNCTQAIARDLLALAMLRLEARSYPVVMHTHDEAVAEMLKGAGSLAEFIAIMCELPNWATGLPVSVAGWRGERYHKE